MDVRPIDPADAGLLARFHDACRRAELHERPWESIWSLDDLRAQIEHPDDGERRELYGVFDGDRLLGGATASFFLLDNTTIVDFHPMVAPEHRRRGAGRMLVDHMVRRAREEGRDTLLAESSYPFEDRETHGYLRFAQACGFSQANLEIVRILDLPVADGLLEDLAEEAAPHHADYRIETFLHDIPEPLLPSYCRVHNQLATDAPTGDIDFEEEQMTPEIFLQGQQRMKASGRTRLAAVAISGADEVVAYSDLVVRPDPGERVQQWGTLVAREHRGHRLGTAVKVANLRELQRRFPDRTEVVTSNAEVNPYMVGINDRLGFRPVAVLPMFQRRI